jgi:hypothetical protein
MLLITLDSNGLFLRLSRALYNREVSMRPWIIGAMCLAGGCLPASASQVGFAPAPLGVKLSVVGSDHPVIIGTVDLPDGFGAVISVLPAPRPDAAELVAAGQSACGVPCFYPQDAGHIGYETAYIKNGAFVTGMFSAIDGGPVRPDTYMATVTFILPERLTRPNSGVLPEVLSAWAAGLNNVAFKTLLHLGRTTPLPSR